MFRLSKTTDYGIVLLAQLASAPEARPSDAPRNARALAESADLPVPMVSKILKALTREGLLVSQRGSKGGYALAYAPEELSVSEMIRVLEGPVALTDCAIGPALCEHESNCAVREPWQRISRVVERALADVTLADLIRGREGARRRSTAAGEPDAGDRAGVGGVGGNRVVGACVVSDAGPTLQIEGTPQALAQQPPSDAAPLDSPGSAAEHDPSPNESRG